MAGPAGKKGVNGNGLETARVCIAPLVTPGATTSVLNVSPEHQPLFTFDPNHSKALKLLSKYPEVSQFYRFGDLSSLPSTLPLSSLKDQAREKQNIASYLYYDVLSNRYPLIHVLTDHYSKAKEKMSEYQQVQKDIFQVISEYQQLLQSSTSSETETKIRELKTKLTGLLHQADQLMRGIREGLPLFEDMVLENGRSPFITLEGALNIAKGMARAYQGIADPKNQNYLKEINDRRLGARPFVELLNGYLQRESGLALKFGVAAFDINITQLNSVNVGVGNLMINITREVLSRHFNGVHTHFEQNHGDGSHARVSNADNTTFRVINPDSKLLNNDKLGEIESEIIRLATQRILANPIYRADAKIIEIFDNPDSAKRFKLNLVAGYADVSFKPTEADNIDLLMERVRNGFFEAQGRTQKGSSDYKLGMTTERFFGLDYPPSQMTGIPEGRYFEPAEQNHNLFPQIRLRHELNNLFLQAGKQSETILEIQKLITQPQEAFDLAQENTLHRELSAQVDSLIETSQKFDKQYELLVFRSSHDLRMVRLVNLKYMPERVDSVIRAYGGVILMLIELEKFKTLTNTYYGGISDKYVHEIIYKILLILGKHGLYFAHNTNNVPVIKENPDTHKLEIIINPQTGKPFEGKTPGDISMVYHRGRPLVSEVFFMAHAGDELAPMLPPVDVLGQPVNEDKLNAVRTDIVEMLDRDYGHMLGPELYKTPDGRRLPTLIQFKQLISDQGSQVKIEEESVGSKEKILAGGGENKFTNQANETYTSPREKEGFTGLFIDYIPERDATTGLGTRLVERWRWVESGVPSPQVFQMPPLEIADPSTIQNISIRPLKAPKTTDHLLIENDSLRLSYRIPEPVFDFFPQAKTPELQITWEKLTSIGAGIVTARLNKGADFPIAYVATNDLSKQAKKEKRLLKYSVEEMDLEERRAAFPEDHLFDQSISQEQTEKAKEYFKNYGRETKYPENIKDGLNPSLKSFFLDPNQEFFTTIDSLDPEKFNHRLGKSLFKLSKEKSSLASQIQEKFGKDGPHAWLRDGLMAAKLLIRERLGIDYRELFANLWVALRMAEFSLEGTPGQAADIILEGQKKLVELYVKQTGELPPFKLFSDQKIQSSGVHIPQELYSLGARYNISPEKIPYLVAGLKAEEFRAGENVFKSVDYQKLSGEEFANPPFLKDFLFKENFGNRLVYRGAPMALGAGSVLLVGGAVSKIEEKLRLNFDLSSTTWQGLHFGATLYLAHPVTLAMSGLYETGFNLAYGATRLNSTLGAKVVSSTYTVIQPNVMGKIIPQQVAHIGLLTSKDSWKALGTSVLEKWGMNVSGQRLSTFGKGLYKVPLNALSTMGAGYLTSHLADHVMNHAFGLRQDSSVRKWVGFGFFWLPDFLKHVVLPSQIAKSSFLQKFGRRFGRVGSWVLRAGVAN